MQIITESNPGRPDVFWNGKWFICFAVLLAALPLLAPTIPPLLDLPSHMASYYIAGNLDSSTALQKYYDFHWHIIGNLGVDLLVMPLQKVFGVELGTKIIVVAIPMMTVAGMLLIARETHGEIPATVGFALPLAYCYPFLFGFANYCLGMAFMLLGFGLWLKLTREARFGLRSLIFAVLSVAVWLAHAIGWGLLVVVCGSFELQRLVRDGDFSVRALWHLAARSLPLFTPLLVMLAIPSHKPSTLSGWFEWHEIAKWLVTVFRDRWIAYDLAAAALFFSVLLLAAVRRAGLRFDASLTFPALAALVLFVVAPRSINDSDFVNGRIAPYALALLIIAISTRKASSRLQHGFAIAGTLFFVVRMVGATASMGLYSASYAENLKALDHVRPGSAIVTFSRTSCSTSTQNWMNARLYHLSGMAVVRRNAFVNSEWQISGLQLLKIKYDAAKPFDSDPSEITTVDCHSNWSKGFDEAMNSFPRRAFDYLWLLDIPRNAWPNDPSLKLAWAFENSALYEVVH